MNHTVIRNHNRTTENVVAVERIVMAHRRVKVRQIVNILRISYGSVESIYHEDLAMSKVCARWVPKILTPEMKRNRVRSTEENLELMNLCWKKFQQRLVTGNETWIHHYDPESKGQSKQWKHIDSRAPNNSRYNPVPEESCAPFSTIPRE